MQDRSTIQALEKAVRDGSEQIILFSMELLAKAEARETAGAVITQLHSPNQRIRKAAQTLGVLGNSRQLPVIAEMLPVEKDPDVLVPLIDAFGKIASHSVNGDSNEIVYNDTEVSPALDMPIVEDPQPLIQFSVLSALEYRKKKGLLTTIKPGPLKALLRSMAEKLCVDHLSRFPITTLSKSLLAATLLCDHLSARIRNGEERVFRTLGLLYDAPMQSIYTSFRSANALERSYAIEVVQNVIEKDLQELILPLLERVPESEMTRFGEQQFALPPFTLPGALQRLLKEEGYWLNAVIYYVIKRDTFNQFQEIFTNLHNPVTFMEEDAMLGTMDKALFLKSVPLFANLDVDDLFYLAQITEEQTFPSNTMIFKEGDMGDSLFLLLSGEVDIPRITEQEAHLLTTLGPKDFFGEMAILSEEPRSASVRTRSQVTALVIEKEEFKEILNRRPEIAQEIIRVLIARLKHTEAQKAR